MDRAPGDGAGLTSASLSADGLIGVAQESSNVAPDDQGQTTLRISGRTSELPTVGRGVTKDLRMRANALSGPVLGPDHPPADATGWRHGAAPRQWLSCFPRPIQEREILRRKSFALAEQICDEAAFDMALLDYDFHLFTESGSGVDSVLYPVRSHQPSPDPARPDRVRMGTEPVSISAAHPPELGVEATVDRLEVTGWPYVFPTADSLGGW